MNNNNNICIVTTVLACLIMTGCQSTKIPVQPAPKPVPDDQIIHPIVFIKPPIPKALKQAGSEGWVLFNVEVGERCKVTQYTVIDSSPKQFEDKMLKSAIKSLTKSCYRPTTSENGGKVVIEFTKSKSLSRHEQTNLHAEIRARKKLKTCLDESLLANKRPSHSDILAEFNKYLIGKKDIDQQAIDQIEEACPDEMEAVAVYYIND